MFADIGAVIGFMGLIGAGTIGITGTIGTTGTIITGIIGITGDDVARSCGHLCNRLKQHIAE